MVTIELAEIASLLRGCLPCRSMADCTIGCMIFATFIQDAQQSVSGGVTLAYQQNSVGHRTQQLVQHDIDACHQWSSIVQ
jgi:hypothetical protein